MLHISVTGIRASGLASLMPAQFVTHRYLSSARKAPGCIRAAAFRHGETIFVYTVWEGKVQMRFFEESPCFAEIVEELERNASLVETQRFLCEHMPGRTELRSLWTSARHILAA